jgi:entericidin B
MNMKKVVFAVLVVVSVLSSMACNTVQGLGKDIERGGQAIEKAAK